jgi:hypothetical protein
VGTQFYSFLLQPGIYQVHLSGDGFQPFQGIAILAAQLPNSGLIVAEWHTTIGIAAGFVNIVGGDRLVQVVSPNTALSIVSFAGSIQSSGACELVITQLQ